MWGSDEIPGRYSPVVGSRNALSAPVRWREVDEGVEGTVTFDVLYQGPPGFVHGGIAALILDVALARACARAGAVGPTAGLTLRYHHPTPLYRELTIRARHESLDGRKSSARGEIRCGDQVCISAEGLFVTARKAETGAAQ
jgi:acyl-coenzyme A thioesterase PaaI-like protein